MGETIRIKCSKCDYSREINIGQGMFDNRSENVIKSFEGDEKKHVSTAMESGEAWNFYRAPGFCVVCNDYYPYPVFESEAIDGGCIIGRCPKCHIAGTQVETDTSGFPGSMKCPICSGEIISETAGMWD